jgi:uncharacterized membrane protein YfcA
MITLVCMVLGALVGLLAGMLGIGGGLLIVPSLLYLFAHQLGQSLEIAMPMAIATSLSTIILTGLSASRAHFKFGNLNRFILVWSSLGIAAGAVAGAYFATMLSGESLKSVFGFLVLAIAIQMIVGRNMSAKGDMSKVALVIVGLVTGWLSALMGIGGGSIMVPALTWFKVNIKQAIGCASFSGLVIALFGSASFVVSGWDVESLPPWSFGYVYLPATLGIVITSVFTAGLGAKISQQLDTRLLKRIFAGFLVIVSLRMMLG